MKNVQHNGTLTVKIVCNTIRDNLRQGKNLMYFNLSELELNNVILKQIFTNQLRFGTTPKICLLLICLNKVNAKTNTFMINTS